MYKIYEKPKISNMVQLMINTLEKYIKTSSKLSERFSLKCFGHEKTLFSMKREKWNESNKRYIYRPIE